MELKESRKGKKTAPTTDDDEIEVTHIKKDNLYVFISKMNGKRSSEQSTRTSTSSNIMEELQESVLKTMDLEVSDYKGL